MKTNKKLLLVLLALMVTAGTFIACSNSDDQPSSSTAPEIIVPDESNTEEPSIAPEEVPAMRQTLNYEGNRYAMVSTMTEKPSIGDPVGTIENLVTLGSDDELFMADFSATFAENGTIYALEGYSPSFRLAVEAEDTYYILENVGKADNSDMDFTTYFADANLSSLVEGVTIYNHFGNEELATLTKEDGQKFISVLESASLADLTVEEYEAVAAAQTNGESYMVKLNYGDDTYSTYYMIPSLGYMSIGDSSATSETFMDEIGDYFADLISSTPLPAE